MGVMPLPVDTGEPPPPTRRAVVARRVALGAVVLALLAGGAWAGGRAYRARHTPAATPAGPGAARGPDTTNDSLARAPAGVRVKVQVVNATRVRGLARRATQALRDRGYDVVEVGTTAQLRDTSLVLDRSGHPEWARRMGRALGGAHVESRPDSSLYLDLTVLVGSAWRPPAEPFYP
ncbi:hypothetical protein tb265_37710 [Gemmatimonadetes bacterium T265]|nr:hypothetical protein tb265_37710 [Gemmatimonadetes bacterium T265]